MTVVQGTALDSGKTPIPRAQIRITLVTGTPTMPGYSAAGELIGPHTATADANGVWSIDLVPNSQITPANTYYLLTEANGTSPINVPAGGGPYSVSQVLVTPPPTPAAPGITGVQVAAAGTVAGVRPEINLVAGSGMAVSAVDNAASNRVDVTLSSSGSAPVTSVNAKTGAVVLSASDVNAVSTSAEGVPGGVATLDGSGHLTSGQDANLLKTSQLGTANGPASLDASGHLTAAQAANLVDTNSGQSIAGVKTFTGEVVVPTPVNSGDAVPKSYADAIAQSLSIKASVQEATAAALPANTYANGAAGVGATLTGTANGALTVDGIAVSLGDRVLVKDEATASHNGIYTVTAVGSGTAPYVLTRSTDMNSAAQIPGAFTFVEQGAVNTAAGFTIASAGPFTLGTTAIPWTQFSGAGEITAGHGLTKAGNTLALATPVAAGDLPRLDQLTAPQAAVGLNSQKITALANGSAASDAAAFGQIPVVGAQGSGAGVALSANDPTTTNARTPTAHASTHASGGSDPVTPDAIGAMTAYWADMLGLGLLTAPLTDSGFTVSQTAGNMVCFLCIAAKTRTVSTLGIQVTAAGVTGSGVNALALYTEAGVLIDQTGDMTAAFSAVGFAEGAMGASHQVVAGTNYYLCVLTHFSGTAPKFAATGTASSANIPVINGHYPALFKAAQASFPASFTPSSFSLNSGHYIAYAR